MHLHILGIGGTFMSSLAILARAAGHHITGCDAKCYPPVSDLLAEKGIVWTEGYDDITDAMQADCVIVGNAIKRGMPVLEAVINARKLYISGPQWLADNILPQYQVLAIAGTHGKTTTTAMAIHILQTMNLQPGFLIGGVLPNLNTSACLGAGTWFVIEADEYDSAFYDKRPKFMHYRPDIAVLNNLEFDHADIYPDLAAIQQQFHYFLRTIPANGVAIKPRDDIALNDVLEKGQYSQMENTALAGDADWRAELLDKSGAAFRVWYRGEAVAEVQWDLLGQFNVENGLMAIAACSHAGVEPVDAAKALCTFSQVKRRLEIRSITNGVTVYDDFAHHPTAITKTIAALKNSGRHQRVLVVLEFASYTMRTGVHASTIHQAIANADGAYLLAPKFDVKGLPHFDKAKSQVFSTTDAIIDSVTSNVEAGDAILVMSNRGFDNIYQKLEDKLLAGLN